MKGDDSGGPGTLAVHQGANHLEFGMMEAVETFSKCEQQQNHPLGEQRAGLVLSGLPWQVTQGANKLKSGRLKRGGLVPSSVCTKFNSTVTKAQSNGQKNNPTKP